MTNFLGSDKAVVMALAFFNPGLYWRTVSLDSLGEMERNPQTLTD